MRKIFSNGYLLGALSLAFVAASPLRAQAPGGGGSQQQQQRPDMNSSAANNPANNPNATNSDTAPSRKMDDKKFAKDAAMGGLIEVELGKLATQKASSDVVKQFGQKMVDDHGKANDQLKEVAHKDNIDIPQTLDAKHQARVDKLSKLSGPAFDKAYVKDQLKDHEKDVSEFKTEAQTGTDPNVKQFASTTLPVLEQHLSMVKDLDKQKK